VPRGALDLALWESLELLAELLDSKLPRRILQDLLNPELRIGQPLPGGTQLCDALLEQDQRLVQIGVIGFELADDRLETLEIRGEGARGRGSRGASHARKLSAISYQVSARDRTSPSPTRKVNRVPGGS
jgi:hypothetical protein